MRKLGSGYVLHEPIGRGAFGQVWRGSTVGGDRQVAVKVLRAELADDPEVVARFVQERSALLGFNSPHLVTVRDLVVEGDTLAIVMDLVNGVDLRVYLRDRGKLTVPVAVALTCQVLRALTVVHAAGVVHRDLKPANVLIDVTDPADPQARLTDFGVARLAHGRSLTRLTGAIGTPLYMAPELAQREHAQPAADVYSAGVMLYELLAGDPPFSGPHPIALLRAHMEDAPTPIADIPPALWNMISWMLAKDPAARPTAAGSESGLALLASSGFQQPARSPRNADHDAPAPAPAEPDDGATALLPANATIVSPRRAGATGTLDLAAPVEISPFIPEPGGTGASQAPTAAGWVRQHDDVLSGRKRPAGRRRRQTAIITVVAVTLLAAGAAALTLTTTQNTATINARPPVASGGTATSHSPAATAAPTASAAAPSLEAPTAPPTTEIALRTASGPGSGSAAGTGNGGAAGGVARSPAAQQSSAAPAPTAPARTYDMPSGFPGSWSGSVGQSGSAAYTVKISLTNGDIGDNVGRASYPELGCVADLFLTDVTSSAIRVQGKLIVNSYNNCVAATLDLTLRSRSAMDYLAQSPGFAGSASAVLYR